MCYYGDTAAAACVYQGVRVYVNVECVFVLWFLCVSTSSSSQSVSPDRERACWVTAVWSSPGLAPDLLSLSSSLSPTVRASFIPLSPTRFPFFLLALSLRTDMVCVYVCMCGHGWLFPTAHTVQLLVYLSCSQQVILFWHFYCVKHHPSSEHCLWSIFSINPCSLFFHYYTYRLYMSVFM